MHSGHSFHTKKLYAAFACPAQALPAAGAGTVGVAHMQPAMGRLQMGK
jgi:hypothetical protein